MCQTRNLDNVTVTNVVVFVCAAAVWAAGVVAQPSSEQSNQGPALPTPL